MNNMNDDVEDKEYRKLTKEIKHKINWLEDTVVLLFIKIFPGGEETG